MVPVHIVVAGASGGIGRALIEVAARRWPTSTLHAVSRQPLNFSVPNLISYTYDLTHAAQCEEFARELSEATSKIHLAIYSIGTLNGSGKRPEKSLNEVTDESLQETFRVNVTGAIAFAKALKPLFRHADDSRFLFLSAKVGSIGDNKTGGWYSYRISKAALNMAVKNLAFEYARSNTKAILIAVHPGTTLTDFSRDYVAQWPDSKVADPEVTAERLLSLAINLENAQSGQFMHWDGTAIEN